MVSRQPLRSDVGRYAMVPEWLLTKPISDKAIRLFAILAAKYADRDGVAYPSRAKLARDLGLAKPTSVDEPLRELEKIGALSVTRGRRDDDDGRQVSNTYTLSFSKPLDEPVQNEGLPSPEKWTGGSPYEGTTPVPNEGITPVPEKGHDPDKYLTRSNEPEGERVAPATLRSPAELVELWNEQRQPGPHVSELSPFRVKRYREALSRNRNREHWSTAIAWLNRQAFANAPGVGEHPTWRASLDWLTKPGKLANVLDSAETDARTPHRRPGRAEQSPAEQLTPDQERARQDAAERRRAANDAEDALLDQAAALVLDLTPAARRPLELDALADLEPFRDRVTPSHFDELVCQALPQRLINRAKGRPLVDVVAELERQAAAA